MLTGDHAVVAAVAAEFGVDAWRAEVLPEDERDAVIALRAAGRTVAVVGLVGDDLRRLLDLRDLGGRTLQVVRQNDGLSIAVNGVGLLLGAGGVLSPVLAAVLHNASSVAVAGNSARLVRYRPGMAVGGAGRGAPLSPRRCPRADRSAGPTPGR